MVFHALFEVRAASSKPRELEIRHNRARIFSFVNFWYSETWTTSCVAEVQLVPTGRGSCVTSTETWGLCSRWRL